jgi:hypothetical protein
MDRARTATTRWLDAGNDRLPHPERFLSLHRHPQLAGRQQDTQQVAWSTT